MTVAKTPPHPRCTGPECDREAVRQGMCQGHYEQRRRHRDRPLRALRGPCGSLADAALVRLPLRVPAPVLEALGDRPGARAREVLTAWADGTQQPSPEVRK